MKKFRLNIISLVISLIAISMVYLRPEPIELDLFNSIITILALLISVLIGWQIYQVINIDKIKKEIELERIHIRNERHEVLSMLYFEVAKTYFENTTKRTWVKTFELYAIKSIYHAAKSKNKTILENMNEEIIDYQLPLVGCDAQTHRKIRDAIFLFDRNDLKQISNYSNLNEFVRI